MKTRFINCLCFASLLSLFPGINGFAQQHEKHEDIVFSHPQVTGVGTPTVTYHLTKKLDPQIGEELKNYFSGLNAIVAVQLKEMEVVLQFKENTTHEMISLYINRLEMNFVYKQKQ